MLIDIVGKKFGRLTVEKFHGVDKSRASLWNCLCDCGNEKIVRGKHLKSNKIVSCGCFRIERVKSSKFKDLTNKKFSRLTVIELDKNIKGKHYWKCLCECGNIKSVLCSKLLNGHTKSCGCLLKEFSSDHMKKMTIHQKGKNHPRWNPSLTDQQRLKRINSKGEEYKLSKWRNEVFKRDNYSCQKCNDSTGGNLNAHHIESWDMNLELRYDFNNGITFCEKCHVEFHKQYGYGKNNKFQLKEYLQ